MDPAALAAAAAAYGAFASPTCLAVVRRGRLVLDRSYWGGAHRRPETNSATKTATAAVLGVAHAQRLFELDTPIARYGVTPGPHANWSDNAAGVDYFPNITARHLLSQTTGMGRFPPGTRFTYDRCAAAHLVGGCKPG